MSESELRGIDDDPHLDIWRDLYPKERAMLTAIARVTTAGGRAWKGDICDRAAEYHEMSTSSGRLAIKELKNKGAIDATPVNKESDKYELSEKGWAMVEAAFGELGELLDARDE